MGVENRSSIRAESKHHLRILQAGSSVVLMAALGRIEQIGDLAEDADNARVEKPENTNRNHTNDGQDEGIFHQRLALFGGRANKGHYRLNQGSHVKWW